MKLKYKIIIVQIKKKKKKKKLIDLKFRTKMDS